MSLDQTALYLAADVARSQNESPPVVMLAVIVGLQLVVGLILWRVFRYGGPDDDDSGEGGDGPGWDRRRPRKPPPDQPVCWPEFERQFAEYVATLRDGARDR